MFVQSAQRIITGIAICVFSLFSLGFSSVRFEAPVARYDSSFENQILQYVNEYRQSKNLSPLRMNTVVSAEAARHSTNMAAGRTAFGHDGFDGRVSAISKQIASRKFAENVAYGHLGAKEVVNIWLNSPGHRHNIEGPYTLTGIGTATKDDGTIFFTQIFIAQ